MATVKFYLDKRRQKKRWYLSDKVECIPQQTNNDSYAVKCIGKRMEWE